MMLIECEVILGSWIQVSQLNEYCKLCDRLQYEVRYHVMSVCYL
jgi:hypothetical protein